MKYLIVGLGNPGVEYKNTRHNIGFKVLNKLADLSNTNFKKEKLADIASIKFKGRLLVLIKPNTFMNLSGKSVNYWMQKEKISIENILVITDDIALPLEKIRIRAKGSDGGHNGLKNIIEVLSTTVFSRVKFGIGSDFKKGKQSEYVLGKWNDSEEKLVEKKIEISIKIIQSFCTVGAIRTMNDFNKNKPLRE